jgi:hypothetical protein
MPIRCDAEAICSLCGAKARCTVELDLVMSRTIASPSAAMFGLPDWYFKEHAGHGVPNLACSTKCMKVLAEDTSYRGEWKHCQK